MTIENQAKSTIESYREKLSDKFGIGNIQKKQYNFEFSTTNNSDKLKVLVYFGKKGVKTVLQGDQDSAFYNEVQELITGKLSLNFGKEIPEEPEEYTGTDESGKGDFFGPLVCAAVFVNPDIKVEMLKLGVQDSKNLSDYSINNIARKMFPILGDKYSIVKIFPQKYNELYPRFRNLNDMLSWLHSKAIKELSERVDFKSVIIDKFIPKGMPIPTELLVKGINFLQETKAEKYTAVAAASILARFTFNKWFYNMNEAGFDLPKGASNQVTQKAKEIKAVFGKEKLNEIAKVHFKTYKLL